MTLGMLLGVVVLVVVVIVAGRWLRGQFEQSARHALHMMEENFLKLAKGELALERQQGTNDLEMKRQAVENAVDGLEKQLQRYETLVTGFEKDRDQKYGALKGEIARVVTEADKLQKTTASLVSVLGNSRVRGQWGQKMAEDILRLCGLQEGVHYLREKELTAGRPDYTFLLPEGHRLFMDVKFPLDNYLKYVGSTSDAEQQRWRDTFIRDVKDHLREMERRDYLAQADQAVDYILIFIPNEQVYGAVNELMPGLIDECLQKKTVLCGPWTLYATVRIIWQAWQNYHYSCAIQDIVKVINGFIRDYENFKKRYEELGERIEQVTKKYEEISNASFKRLEQKIDKIEEYRRGQRIPEEVPEVETLMLEPTKQTGEDI